MKRQGRNVTANLQHGQGVGKNDSKPELAQQAVDADATYVYKSALVMTCSANMQREGRPY